MPPCIWMRWVVCVFNFWLLYLRSCAGIVWYESTSGPWPTKNRQSKALLGTLDTQTRNGLLRALCGFQKVRGGLRVQGYRAWVIPAVLSMGNSRKRSERVSGVFLEFLPGSPSRTGVWPIKTLRMIFKTWEPSLLLLRSLSPFGPRSLQKKTPDTDSDFWEPVDHLQGSLGPSGPETPKNQARKKSTKINFLGPETARWGGGFPLEGVVAENFVPALESLSSLGFEERNLGCPRNFAGISRTLGGAQKVRAKKLRAHFSFPKKVWKKSPGASGLGPPKVRKTSRKSLESLEKVSEKPRESGKSLSKRSRKDSFETFSRLSGGLGPEAPGDFFRLSATDGSRDPCKWSTCSQTPISQGVRP